MPTRSLKSALRTFAIKKPSAGGAVAIEVFAAPMDVSTRSLENPFPHDCGREDICSPIRCHRYLRSASGRVEAWLETVSHTLVIAKTFAVLSVAIDLFAAPVDVPTRGLETVSHTMAIEGAICSPICCSSCLRIANEPVHANTSGQLHFNASELRPGNSTYGLNASRAKRLRSASRHENWPSE